MAYNLPITISDGDFSDPASGLGTTPLAKIAVRFSEAVINTAWARGEEKSTAADEKSAALSADLAALVETPGDYHVTAGSVSLPSVTAPNVNIPESIDTSTILATFDEKYPDIATFLQGQASYIIATYFPDAETLYAAADGWLGDAIADGGISDSVRAQLLGIDEAVIVDAKIRAQDAVIAQFAARGFPLPPDVAASAVLQIEQKAQDQIAESGRKVSALALENMKWAVNQVKELRGVAMSSMVQYVQAVGKGAIDAAASITGLGYGEQAKLISSAAAFYSADTNAKEMVSKVAQFNETLALDAGAKNQSTNIALQEMRARALIADLQTTMQQATALFNNLHASAGTSLTL